MDFFFCHHINYLNVLKIPEELHRLKSSSCNDNTDYRTQNSIFMLGRRNLNLTVLPWYFCKVHTFKYRLNANFPNLGTHYIRENTILSHSSVEFDSSIFITTASNPKQCNWWCQTSWQPFPHGLLFKEPHKMLRNVPYTIIKHQTNPDQCLHERHLVCSTQTTKSRLSINLKLSQTKSSVQATSGPRQQGRTVQG
jgi:hypothetical protein